MTVFFRLLDASADDKASELHSAIALLRDTITLRRPGIIFEREPNAFRALPETPFPYWASDTIIELFSRFQPFGTGENTVKQGLASGDDFRLMRLWWEPPLTKQGESSPWTTVSKGGSSRPYYADLPLLIGYARAHQVAIQQTGRFGRGATHYYLPGLTYSLRASRFRPQALPAKAITTVRGSGIYAFPCAAPFLALFNSSTVDYLLKLMLGRGGHPQFDMGDIAALPIPYIDDSAQLALSAVARKAWSAQRSLDTANETSHAFILPPGLNEKITGLNRDSIERELEAIQRRIDDVAFVLYGIGPEDRAAIESSSNRAHSNADGGQDDRDTENDSSEDDAPLGAVTDSATSWLVGVAFGRFDPRLATAERAVPPEPDPFDAQPMRSPGMWPEDEEPSDWPDIMIDDEGHTEDVVRRVRAVADRVRVDAPDNLRIWLAREFFPLHIRMYSKSRRKAPIYWQLATSSASYSVWLYIHAFTGDTLFRVQNDYVVPKLAHEERRLAGMRRDAGEERKAAERKAIAVQEVFVEELRAFLDEVKRIAPLWNPNLDDGVIINFAPLWRLVPHHKPWQRELKSTWDALCAGEYDWSHLAMHLWPERVVPKCATDRSLAIAHGLEEVFWTEGADGKWSPRSRPTRTIDDLVRERTSPAVKAALKNLLEAPVAAANGVRGRNRRSATAT